MLTKTTFYYIALQAIYTAGINFGNFIMKSFCNCILPKENLFPYLSMKNVCLTSVCIYFVVLHISILKCYV
jgi:hypothetical protein